MQQPFYQKDRLYKTMYLLFVAGCITLIKHRCVAHFNSFTKLGNHKNAFFVHGNSAVAVCDATKATCVFQSMDNKKIRN